jgi:cell division protease FtsH
MEPDARKRQVTIWYTIAAVIGVLLFQQFWLSYAQVETIPYSEFERLLKDGKVAAVTVGTDAIEGTLKEPLPSGKRAFYAVRVDPQLADKLAAQNVEVRGAPSGGLVQTILSWVVPAIIFYLVWMLIFRRVAEKQGVGGLMTIGKSRAKVYVETDTKVTFKDVAGVEEAKFELEEVVAFLRNPKAYGRLGVSIGAQL